MHMQAPLFFLYFFYVKAPKEADKRKRHNMLKNNNKGNNHASLYTRAQSVAIKEWTDLSFAQEEVDLQIQLAHEHVIRVIGMLTFPIYSLVLELAEGSLLDRLKAYQSGQVAYPYEARLETAILLAQGLCYLHNTAKIALRDIKPENVLCVNGKPKWADFGLATRVDDKGNAISTTHDVGTYGYAAPEQFSRRRPKSGTSSDIFAFGRLLHDLLFGLSNLTAQESKSISHNGPTYEEGSPYADSSQVSHLDSRIAFFATIRKCGERTPASRPNATQVQEELVQSMRHMYTPQ